MSHGPWLPMIETYIETCQSLVSLGTLLARVAHLTGRTVVADIAAVSLVALRVDAALASLSAGSLVSGQTLHTTWPMGTWVSWGAGRAVRTVASVDSVRTARPLNSVHAMVARLTSWSRVSLVALNDVE